MADYQNENQRETSGRTFSSGPAPSVPNIPPPPPEVKIRTMKSDLESMAQSGGGAPQFKTVRAPSLVFAREESPKKPVAGEERAGKFWLITVPLIAIALLAGIIYFAYNFFAARTVNQTQSAQAPLASAPTEKTSPPVSLVPNAAPSAIFKKPADQVLMLVINKSVTSAADLQTFSQKLGALVGAASSSATLVQVNMQYSGGSPLGIGDVFSLADSYVLPPQFFADHFRPDAVAFAYKDKNGIWPGYVLTLKSAENWLFLQKEASALEKSSKINNFFLIQPGSPSPNGFVDATVSGQPARILTFSTPSSSQVSAGNLGGQAAFIYSWSSGGYLVFSTSLDGLKAALARMQ